MAIQKRKSRNRHSYSMEEVPRLPKTEPLQLRYYGDPVLRKRAEPVQEITDVERLLADNMLETLYGSLGIGLAATQVGILKRFIIVDIGVVEDREEFEPLRLFNPEILSVDGESVLEEGCLSIPDLRVDVKRPEHIVVKAMNMDSEDVQIEADGLLARVIQHEIDHLNGVLFIDKISGLKRELLRDHLKIIQQAERPD